MWALELPGHVAWSADLVIVSVLCGVLFAGAALPLAMRRDDFTGTVAAAALLTLAIVSHHFVAMGAAEIVPDPTRAADEFSISPTVLALAVTGATIGILGVSFVGAFANRHLRERDAQLITAVNNMSQGLIMFDASERLIVCNNCYIEMYGLSRDVVRPGATLRAILRSPPQSGTLAPAPASY